MSSVFFVHRLCLLIIIYFEGWLMIIIEWWVCSVFWLGSQNSLICFQYSFVSHIFSMPSLFSSLPNVSHVVGCWCHLICMSIGNLIVFSEWTRKTGVLTQGKLIQMYCVLWIYANNQLIEGEHLSLAQWEISSWTQE